MSIDVLSLGLPDYQNVTDYPSEGYVLEEIKNGVIVRCIDLCKQPCTVVGRSDDCHLVLSHPSISRQHAVIAWRQTENGSIEPYLLDMGSTHGTRLNKQIITGYSYHKLANGFRIAFGASSRYYAVKAPHEHLKEKESFIDTEFTHSQMRSVYKRFREISNKVKKRRLESDREAMAEIIDKIDSAKDEACIDDSPKKYHTDPRGELAKFFQRIGQDMQMNIEKLEDNQLACSISLPAHDESGHAITVEMVGACGRKQLIRKCATEACERLDEMDMLYADAGLSNPSSHQRSRLVQNDFYSSDEDSFFDRTGEIDRKRRARINRYIQSSFNEELSLELGRAETVHTFQSATAVARRCFEEEIDLRRKLFKAKGIEEALDQNDLDEYVRSLQNGALNSRERAEIRLRLTNLVHEKSKALRLVKVASNDTDEYNTWLEEVSTFEGRLRDISNADDAKQREQIRKEDVQRSISSESFTSKEALPTVKQSQLDCQVDKRCDQSLPEPVKADVSLTNRLPCKKAVAERYADADKFVEWQPPQGQSGDGQTSLNVKYGY